jgi:serine protease Do
VLGQLVEQGEVKRGWLGVGIDDVTAENAVAAGVDPNLKGALVKRVFAGDPANLAGIQVNDVIVRIGEAVIEEASDVSQAVGALAAGTIVEIGIVRGAESLVASATLTERPSEAELANYTGQGSSAEEAATTAFGMTVGSITEVVARQLGLNSTEGVVIMDVARGGRAEQAGLVAGDVILGVNQQAIDSVETWNTVVGSLGADDRVSLTVFRAGRLGIVRL